MILLISLRLMELLISKRNEAWLRGLGAIEYGRGHYPSMIALHTSFLISLIVEFWIKPVKEFNVWLLLLFIILTVLKVVVVSSLGKYWTTRIYRVPGTPLITSGIYKYFRHPNYAIVVVEVLVIPFIFDLTYTAIIFSALNAAMLFIRIKEEEKALNR